MFGFINIFKTFSNWLKIAYLCHICLHLLVIIITLKVYYIFIIYKISSLYHYFVKNIFLFIGISKKFSFTELRQISETYNSMYDLDVYVKKLMNAKRRVMLVNNILQNAQVCNITCIYISFLLLQLILMHLFFTYWI